MKVRTAGLVAFTLLTVIVADARGQAAPDTAMVGVVTRLFQAIRQADTAAGRAAFVPEGRVVGVAGAAPATAPVILNVDAFVRFMGQNRPDARVQHLWNPRTTVAGPLGALWFDYDVYMNGSLAQCGSQSVEMQRTGTGWTILTMTFSAQTAGCSVRSPPEEVNGRR